MAEARLYGDKEYGGLHALFLLTDKPEAYKPAQRGERGAAEPQQRPQLPGLAGHRRCSALVGAVVAFRERGGGRS